MENYSARRTPSFRETAKGIAWFLACPGIRARVEAAASNPGICSRLLSFGTFSTGRKEEGGRAYATHKYLYTSPVRCQQQVARSEWNARERTWRSIVAMQRDEESPNLDLHGSNEHEEDFGRSGEGYSPRSASGSRRCLEFGLEPWKLGRNPLGKGGGGELCMIEVARDWKARDSLASRTDDSDRRSSSARFDGIQTSKTCISAYVDVKFAGDDERHIGIMYVIGERRRAFIDNNQRHLMSLGLAQSRRVDMWVYRS